jgi:zinc transport system ATP-binding protein
MAMDSKYLSLKNISFSYADYPVLTDISFNAERGEIISIIGPNGSGKTTLLKIIIGVLPPSSGKVLLKGKSPRAFRSQIAYVPQKFNFDRNIPLSIEEFMDLDDCGHKDHGKANIGDMLNKVGLAGAGKKKLGELSGGQFQRVMIARALLHKKEILAFDEPLSGIDSAGGSTIYDLITKVNHEQKVTFLIVSHELSVVSRYSSQVLCINNKLCCQGRPAEVLNSKMIKSLYGEQAGLYHGH